MELERIRKRPEDYTGADLVDYDESARTFSWAKARELLDGLPGGGLNIAYEAIDRHVKGGRGDKLALRRIGRDNTIRDFTYATLGATINQFANALTQHGIGNGDRVFSLLGRVPELYIAALGTLKNGSVFSPLFSASGPEPIKARMTIGDASAVITTEAFYRRKIEPWRKGLPSLRSVFLTECSASPRRTRSILPQPWHNGMGRGGDRPDAVGAAKEKGAARAAPCSADSVRLI